MQPSQFHHRHSAQEYRFSRWLKNVSERLTSRRVARARQVALAHSSFVVDDNVVKVWLVFVCTLAGAAADARTLDEYRHFRTLAIDLLGRVPTRSEVAAFERPEFKLDEWIDKQLRGPGYADRLVRVYMDLLRLEVGPAFTYAPQVATLHRQQILGPDGKPLFVYYRQNQRRAREATDGEFCLTAAETGIQLLPNNQVRGTPIPITKAALAVNTTVVKPWWLYRDHRLPMPMLLYKQSWINPDTLFQPADDLVIDPDKSPTVEIRICKEEAQEHDSGHVHVTGRQPPPAGSMPPDGRLRPLPLDDGFAKQHKGEPLSCRSSLSLSMSIDCGCGPALEWCMPGSDGGNDPRAFALPSHVPLGIDQPIDNVPQSVSAWYRFWWSQEAIHFLQNLFAGDRDFREILTGRFTVVNGALVQFYRAGEPASCCGREKAFGMTTESQPLFDPKNLPDLLPSDVRVWKVVNDRGSLAAGLLTMPAFLTKFASRRARAAVLYNTFLCKSFVAGNVPLSPSTEPNLMVRPGCSTCHATLEPLAAYFSRVEETNWVYLPEWQFPLRNFTCKKNAQGKVPGQCETFYDPAFSDDKAGLLRGAYASIDHAAAGPVGAGEMFAGSSEFGRCAVERVTSSFLGRPLTDDDGALLLSLTDTFVKSGYHMRALVRGIVTSDVYRRSNNMREMP